MLFIISLIPCIILEEILYTASIVSWIYNFPLPGRLVLNTQPAVREDLGNVGFPETPGSVSQCSVLGMSQLSDQGRGGGACPTRGHTGGADGKEQLCSPGPAVGSFPWNKWGKELSQDSGAHSQGSASPCLCGHSSGQTGPLKLPWNLHTSTDRGHTLFHHSQDGASWLQGYTASLFQHHRVFNHINGCPPTLPLAILKDICILLQPPWFQ